MAEVVNLRQARKNKARTAAEKAASENRARYGQTKATRQKAALEKQQTTRSLDGHKRTTPEDSHGH